MYKTLSNTGNDFLKKKTKITHLSIKFGFFHGNSTFKIVNGSNEMKN